MTSRRSFVGSLIGGFLAAVGLKMAPKRWEGMIPAGSHPSYTLAAATDPADTVIDMGSVQSSYASHYNRMLAEYDRHYASAEWITSNEGVWVRVEPRA